MWPCHSASFSLAKLCKLSLVPWFICPDQVLWFIWPSHSNPEAKLFPRQGLPAQGWVTLKVTENAKRRWRLPLCVAEVLQKEKCMTASQVRANCAITLAWLGCGGMTLYQGRRHAHHFVPCFVLEEKDCNMLGILRRHEQHLSKSHCLGWPEVQKHSESAETVMLWISFQEAEKRIWEENI